MNIEEAGSRVQVLINAFNGLKYLEEVLDAARAADQLTKERDGLAEKARSELEAVQKKLAAAKAKHDDTVAKYEDADKRLVEAYAEKSATLEAEFAARSKELADELTAAKQNINAAHGEYDAFVLQANDQKAALQADIDKLEKALATLKTKVGGML